MAFASGSSGASEPAGAGRPPSNEDHQHRQLLAASKRTRLPLEQLWTRYFALGGDAGALEIEAYFQGLMALPALQRDILAQAINERLDEVVGPQRAPYSRMIRERRPSEGPLAALLDLLEGTHGAPPERFPEICATAGHALGVELIVYLVDYEQHMAQRREIG